MLYIISNMRTIFMKIRSIIDQFSSSLQPKFQSFHFISFSQHFPKTLKKPIFSAGNSARVVKIKRESSTIPVIGKCQKKVAFKTLPSIKIDFKMSSSTNGQGDPILESETVKSLLHTIVDYSPTGVINFIQPGPLEQVLTEKLEKAIQSPSNVASVKDMETTAEYVMSYCVNTSHPYFLNQLYGGVHPMGLAAAYIVEKMNTNAHTYEVAPVFVLTERIILKKLRLQFFGNEEGDGLFAPGGSMSNMYGYTLARHRYFPDVKQKGLFGMPPLVLYTSQDSHYSASKAANWMGLGLENVVKVKTNRLGQMIPSELEAAIKQSKADGKVPLVVNATSGTTVLGAFDDLEAISEICKRENIWLHCDAAWGGSFIFSERLRMENMKGIEKCDSVAWNAHKMLGAPLQCSIFITKEPDCLSKCNSLSASYLFQPDKYYPVEYDRSGDKSFQCGRKADSFKLWFMWVALGTNGFRKLIENSEECARYISEKISMRDDCILYLGKHQCTNVFFWYIPPRMQGQDKTEAWWTELGDITRQIKEKMVLNGSLMIGYSPIPHKNISNAIRLVIPSYPPKSREDMDYVLDNIVNLGKNL